MKKIILLLLFIPLVSFGQDKIKYKEKNKTHKEGNTEIVETFLYSKKKSTKNWIKGPLLRKTIYYDNNTAKEIGYYEKGDPLTKNIWKEGIVAYIDYYNGDYESFYPNGNILFKGKYKNRRPYGVWNVFSENKMYEAYGKRIKNGLVSGEWIVKKSSSPKGDGKDYSNVIFFKSPVEIDYIIEKLNKLN